MMITLALLVAALFAYVAYLHIVLKDLYAGQDVLLDEIRLAVKLRATVYSQQQALLEQKEKLEEFNNELQAFANAMLQVDFVGNSDEEA